MKIVDIGQTQDSAIKLRITCWFTARNLVTLVRMEKMDKVRNYNKFFIFTFFEDEISCISIAESTV